MSGFIRKYVNFLTHDVWRIRSKELPKSQSFWLKQLRIILLAIRGFNEDRCQLRASALTFYSLLSVVPVVAMAFGVAKGFGLEKTLEKQLVENLQGQEEVAQRIIEFSNAMLENTQGGLIAGIGIGVLFWTVIKVLGHIENSFNDIWGVKKSRSLVRKFSDYLSIMLICPILLIISSSVTVLITSQIQLILEKLSFLGSLLPMLISAVNLLSYAVIWIGFTFIYTFMPNTKVQFRSAFLAGVIAGTIYKLVQWGYISFQVGVAEQGAIYGSFAALPLFLIWLQISWLVVLFGAEISFAEQNVETYEFEPDCLNVSYSFKKRVALMITQVCVRRFCDEQEPLTAQGIAKNFDLPIRLVNEVLYELTESGILSEVKTESKDYAFQPARNIESLTVKNVLDILEHHGSHDIPMRETAELKIIKDSLDGFDATTKSLPENIALKDIK